MTQLKDNEKIWLRASSIKSAFGCLQQFGRTHILKQVDFQGSRAAVGTAIHSAAEHYWSECKKKNEKVFFNVSGLSSIAQEKFMKIAAEERGINYAPKDSLESCLDLVAKGVNGLADIMPHLGIPEEIEKRFHWEIDHPIVKGFTGQVDYLTQDTIGDIKTSGKKSSGIGHQVQLSMYAKLAMEAGYPIEKAQIYQIVLTKEPQADIIDLELNIGYAEVLLQSLLDKIEELYKAEPDDFMRKFDLHFPGNPNHNFCNKYYCRYFNACKFSQKVFD